MYGLISKIKANSAQRDTLVAILVDASAALPGCLSYVVAKDANDPDAMWVTEVWDSPASHHASLTVPAVRQAIAKAGPLIAGFEKRFETKPAGGHGLVPA